jgi:hypothetical protein
VAAKRLIRSYPDLPMIYRWYAAALGQLGRLAEAKEALDKAVSRTPAAFDMYVRNRAPWFRPEDHGISSRVCARLAGRVEAAFEVCRCRPIRTACDLQANIRYRVISRSVAGFTTCPIHPQNGCRLYLRLPRFTWPGAPTEGIRGRRLWKCAPWWPLPRALRICVPKNPRQPEDYTSRSWSKRPMHRTDRCYPPGILTTLISIAEK